MTDSTGRKLTWITAGNLTFLAGQAGTLIVLARLGNPELVGRFALGMAIVSPIVLFFQLRLRDLLATDARGRHAVRDYLELSLVGSLSAIAVVAIATLLLGYWTTYAPITLMLAVAKLFETSSFTIYGLLQRCERMADVGRSLMLRSVLGLTGLSLGLIWQGTLFAAVSGLGMGWALVTVGHDLPLAVRVKRSEGGTAPPRGLRTLGSLALLALPLGAGQALVSINANVPRFLVERFVGEWELGLFSAIAYLAVAGANIMGSLGQTFAPRLARFFHAGELDRVRSLLWRLLAAAFGLGISGVLVAFVAGGPILRLLYGPAHGDESRVLVWVMVYGAFLFASMPLSQLLITMRLLNTRLAILSVALVACIAAGLLLIPSYGIIGAAWALIAGTATRFALSLVIVRRQVRTSAVA